jgi:hypothetical protein
MAAAQNGKKIVSLTAHLEKVTTTYQNALAGNFPPKHESHKESFLRFLKKEVDLHTKKIAQLREG